MKDIFQEFKQATLRKHFAVGLTAFAFALGVNMFLFNTDTWVRMQASAIEATKWGVTTTAPDISVIQNATWTDRASIQIGRAIANVKEIELTLLGDPEKISFNDAIIGDGFTADVVTTSSTGGILLVKVLFPAPVNLVAGTVVSTLGFSKKVGVNTEINIVSPRVTATDGVYELTSKGVEVK